MIKISGNVYEHRGVKLEAVSFMGTQPCRECPFLPGENICGGQEFDCHSTIGRDRVFRKYKEPETMKEIKLCDVSFNVVTLTPDRSRILQEAIFAAGGAWSSGDRKVKLTEKPVLWLCDCDLLAQDYIDNDKPELTLQQALDLLKTAKKPEPVFDIKPFDKVIYRIDSNGSSNWAPGFFAFIAVNKPWMIGIDCPVLRFVKYEGNEKYSGLPGFPVKNPEHPSGWWEVKNNAPVWVTK